MKRIFSLILVLAMILSLCSCGSVEQNSSKLSKEDMLMEAEEVSATDIQNDSIDNIVAAKQKYCNKTILLSGSVRSIKENYIELSASFGSNFMTDVYLSTDELSTLKTGQSITVVGTTTDKIIETSENVAGFTLDYNHYQMPNAYLVNDRVEVVGILKGINTSYTPAFNIKIGESNVYKLIYFAENVDTSALKSGQTIKFSAKAINENNSWHYYDAEIIE